MSNTDDFPNSVSGDTIIGFTLPSRAKLKSLLSPRPDNGAEAPAEPLAADAPYLKIRAANSAGQRSSASILVNRMYSARGYLSLAAPGRDQPPHQMTLTATERDEAVGTLTIGFDHPGGLLADDLFKQEVDTLRAQHKKVCEFTKLAMDSTARSKSKRALASMFHVAYIYAHRIHGFTTLVIEVNPRHVGYYERMLGFKAIGEERLNRRVNAPAVLLKLEFLDLQSQIGAHHGSAPTDKSLYAHAFSVQEEAAIVGRLYGLMAHR